MEEIRMKSEIVPVRVLKFSWKMHVDGSNGLWRNI